MSRIDQFESAFRATAREPFRYDPASIGRILIVTDRETEATASFERRVRAYLGVLEANSPEYRSVGAGAYESVQELLDLAERHEPDLICTYRNLRTEAWRWAYTLGDHLEVLTQVASAPVLVMPHPEDASEQRIAQTTEAVTVITDHLTGDHRIVNTAAALTAPGGRLWLTHVEDGAAFDRLMDVIAKIPSIDTDSARAEIRERLLKEPHDYIGSCAHGLARAGLDLHVEEAVSMGHRLREYQSIVQQHEVDLLVLNTKDNDQLAMHGLAHPIAVEMRHTPLLML